MTSTTKNAIALKWIKADSGKTYICNVHALAGNDRPSEADLERLCVNESENPQND